MPVQEFECQIARGQIGRYLNGDGLSSEALRQLGAHVAECSECKTFLDHRKSALQGMLGEAPMPVGETARAVVDVNPSEALIAQIRAKTVEEEPQPAASAAPKPTKPLVTKPIIYCGLLGLVLVGMTYLTRNPSGLLGPHASQIVAAGPPPQEADKKATEIPPDSAKAESNSASDSAAKDAAKTLSATDAKPPATGAADIKSAETKPIPTEKPVTASIEPTKPVTSPLQLDPKSSGQDQADDSDSSSSSVSESPAKVAAAKKLDSRRPATKSKWHRRTIGHRRWGLHHLQPGTGAIHVYGPSN